MDRYTLPPLVVKPGLPGLKARIDHQMFKFVIWTNRKMSLKRVRVWVIACWYIATLVPAGIVLLDDIFGIF